MEQQVASINWHRISRDYRKKSRGKAKAKRRTHDLPHLAPGQTVYIQNPRGRRRWDKMGHRKHSGQKYWVKFEDGAGRYVNRIQLRPAYGGGSEDHASDIGVAGSVPVALTDSRNGTSDSDFTTRKLIDKNVTF